MFFGVMDARVDQGRLVYQLGLPIRGRGAPHGTVDGVIDDPNHVVAFMLVPGTPVKVTAAAPFEASRRIVRRRLRTRSM